MNVLKNKKVAGIGEMIKKLDYVVKWVWKICCMVFGSGTLSKD